LTVTGGIDAFLTAASVESREVLTKPDEAADNVGAMMHPYGMLAVAIV
jgi:hypothetical protein